MPKVRGFVRRSIEIAETDLETWTGGGEGQPLDPGKEGFKTVLIADELDDAGVAARVERVRSILDYDNPDHYHAQLHHMVAFPYASLTLGMVTIWDNVWYTDREPLFSGGRDRSIVHTQLTWTRDADWLDWHRIEERKPLIETSDPGEWDCAVRGCPSILPSG